MSGTGSQRPSNVHVPKAGGSSRALYTGLAMMVAGVVLVTYGMRSKRTDLNNNSIETPTWQHRIEQQHDNVQGSKPIINKGSGSEPVAKSNTKDIPLPSNDNNRVNGGTAFTSLMAGQNTSRPSEPTAQRVDPETGTTYTKAPSYANPQAGKPQGYKKTPGDSR